jgi:peptidoglycan/xylan/chitin deacetylase (PgdA/CDA1 family)
MKRARAIALAAAASLAMGTGVSAAAEAQAVAVPPSLPEPEPLSPVSARQLPSSVPIVRRVDNPDMQIAITFDACATNSYGYGFDRPVFEVLRREQIPVTIFVSGLWVESHSDEMNELAAEPMIEFANHSYHHPHMAKLSSAEIGDEIDRTEAALSRHGVRSVAFRPPFGEFSDRVLEVARARHLPAILWDVVSGDPSVGATAEAMIRTVLSKTRVGSIVIFHINGRETKTASALPPILRQLRARGFQFVQISTLLAWGDFSQVSPRVGADDPAPPSRPVARFPVIAPVPSSTPADMLDRTSPYCDGRGGPGCL